MRGGEEERGDGGGKWAERHRSSLNHTPLSLTHTLTHHSHSLTQTVRQTHTHTPISVNCITITDTAHSLSHKERQTHSTGERSCLIRHWRLRDDDDIPPPPLNHSPCGLDDLHTPAGKQGPKAKHLPSVWTSTHLHTHSHTDHSLTLSKRDRGAERGRQCNSRADWTVRDRPIRSLPGETWGTVLHLPPDPARCFSIFRAHTPHCHHRSSSSPPKGRRQQRQ